MKRTSVEQSAWRLILVALLVLVPAAASAQVIPSAQVLSRAVQEAYDKFRDVKEGANADYIPELAKVPSELFGVAIVTARGDVYTAGDVDYAFTIQSVSKPFTAALVMQEQGTASVIAEKIGVEPTGLPFNSILATQILKPVSVNPLVNSGAIASVSLVKAKSGEERFARIMDFFRPIRSEMVPKAMPPKDEANRVIVTMKPAMPG
jgi:glutaminase